MGCTSPGGSREHASLAVPVLRDHQLPAKTLQARDRLTAALRGDDVDEQRKAFEELRRLKLRDIARAEAAAAARRFRDMDESSWKRIKVHHPRREP